MALWEDFLCPQDIRAAIRFKNWAYHLVCCVSQLKVVAVIGNLMEKLSVHHTDKKLDGVGPFDNKPSTD